MNRRNVARVAAPVAFLVAVTIAALVARGFEHGRHQVASPTTAVSTGKTQTTAKHARKRASVRSYTVQHGDTFESIATKTGTSVAKLEQLNPGVDPTALSVGQKIRVQ